VNGDLLFREILEGADLPIGTTDSSRLRFPIYSITKTMTAVCALRLHEKGLLNLDELVTHWFPDLPLYRTMTVTHLLRHTSGIPDYGTIPDYHDAVSTTPYSPWSSEEFLEMTLGQGTRFEPGNGWSYSNTGYMLAAADSRVDLRCELP
jgi:D-alanyl-D-alanine carboxypeptidase